MASDLSTLDNLFVFNHSDIDLSHSTTTPECNASPRELLSIPAELRDKVYKFYFADMSFTLHACPNDGYVFQNGKTSHDFIFPQCPKSLKDIPDEMDSNSGKNLLLVNKQVKNEAYKFFMSEPLFVLDEATCMTTAMFLQYKPIKNIQWEMDEPTVAGVLKMAAITKQYADRCALNWFGSSWCFNFEDWDISRARKSILLMMGAILSSVRTINTGIASLEFVKWREPEASGDEYDGEDEAEEEVKEGINNKEDDIDVESVILFQNPTKDPASWNMIMSIYGLTGLRRLIPAVVLAQTKPNEWTLNGSVWTLTKPAEYVVHGKFDLALHLHHGHRVNGNPVPETRFSLLKLDTSEVRPSS